MIDILSFIENVVDHGNPILDFEVVDEKGSDTADCQLDEVESGLVLGRLDRTNRNDREDIRA